jgi:hypothetical protein
MGKYRVELPARVQFPGPGFCDGKQEFLLVGKYKTTTRPEVINIYFDGGGPKDMSYHVEIDFIKSLAKRWVLLNGTKTSEVEEPSLLVSDQNFELR